MFTHEDITTGDLRSTAVTLGTWNVVRDLIISTEESAGIHHSPGGNHSPQGAARLQDSVGNLRGTLCCCLTSHIAHFGRTQTVGHLAKFLQMTLVHHYVGTKTARFREDPSFSAWTELWNLAAGPIGTEALCTTSDQRYRAWEPEAVPLLREVAEQLQTTVLRPTAQMLLAACSKEHRDQALAIFRERCSTSTQNSTDTLVAVRRLGTAGVCSRQAGQDLLATHLIYWDEGNEGTTLYRLPQWAHDVLKVGVPVFGDHLYQGEPWVENLPLATIAGLWDPQSQSEMADLSSVIEAAQII